MKKIILALLVSIMAVSPVFAIDDIVTVDINGITLSSPIPARIVNDRTMLPMRSVFEALGAKVSWSGSDQLIFATKDDTFVSLKVGSTQMVIQTVDSVESKNITLDTAPFIDNDYTLIPVRAAAEALKAIVEWNPETRTVSITNTNKYE